LFKVLVIFGVPGCLNLELFITKYFNIYNLNLSDIEV